MAAYEADKPRFDRLNAHVLGISTDPVPTKVAWANSLGGISFDLLSDFFPHGAVSEQYGVLRPEGFPVRAIFVVDPEGRIAWMRKYDIGEHPETRELLGELEQLVKRRV
jgi:alkyl hydroperoxide reductase subunit AhpC